jgi:hypothetical protein
MAKTPFKVKDQLLVPDSAVTPPLNITERSAPPSTPAVDDLYLDDGTNTASGSPGWRRCVSIGPNVWEDVGAVGGAGASPWSKTVAVVHPTTITDTVAINSSVMAGSEKLLVFDDRETGATQGLEVFFNKDGIGVGDKASWVGIRSKIDHDGDDDVTNYYANFVSEATVNNASATLPLHLGFVNTTELLDGAITDAVGFQTQASIAATKTMATYTGFKAESNASGGAITTVTGVQVEDQGQGSTTAYGVRIEDQTATTAYGLWQDGSSDLNYLAGHTGINQAPSSTEVLAVTDTIQSGSTYGQRIRLTKTDAVAKTGWYGLDVLAFHSGAGVPTSYYGVNAAVLITNAVAALTNYYGFRSTLTSNAAVTNAVGFLSHPANLDATVTTYHGFHAEAPTSAGSGVITNSYGVFVEDQGLGSATAYGVFVDAQTATTGYGLYQNGPSDLNVLRGATAIGGTTVMLSSEVLRVTGVAGSVAPTTTLVVEASSTNGGFPPLVTGVDVYMANGAAANVGGWFGVRVNTPTSGGAGAISAAYGVLIDNQNGGDSNSTRGVHIAAQTAVVGATSAFGIWQDGTANYNVLRGYLAVGNTTMSGTEHLRVSGDVLVDSNSTLTIADSATIPPLNITERAAAPTAPAVDDIYLDSGGIGTPRFRRCVSIGPAVWEDITAGGGSALWSQTLTAIHPTTITDPVTIGKTAVTAQNEHLYVHHTVNGLSTSAAVVRFEAPGGPLLTLASVLDLDLFANTESITTGYGLRITNARNSAAISTMVGIEIGDLNANTATNTAISIVAQTGGPNIYGIYQAGSTEINVFNGVMAVANTAMSGSEKLRVSGDVLVDGAGNVGVGASPSGVARIHLEDVRDPPTIISGTIWYGVQSHLTKTGTNSSAGYTGLETDITINAANGAINRWRGLQVSSPGGTGLATAIGSISGVFIQAMATGPAALATAHGIYQEGANDDNYFAGNVGIGNSGPTYELDVTGDARITSQLGIEVAPSSTRMINASLTLGALGTTAYGIYADLSQTTGTLAAYRGFYSDAGVATCTTLQHFYAGTPSGTFTNLYGVYIATQNSGSVTNAYGVYQAGSTDRNHFIGPVVVGSSTAPGTSVGLEVNSTTKALLVSRMSTAQRNALTAVNGMVLYDSTTDYLNFRINGNWVERPVGLTGTFNFHSSLSGQITSMTFLDGVLTAVTTVP